MWKNLKSPSLCVQFMVFCCILRCFVAKKFCFCNLRCFSQYWFVAIYLLLCGENFIQKQWLWRKWLKWGVLWHGMSGASSGTSGACLGSWRYPQCYMHLWCRFFSTLFVDMFGCNWFSFSVSVAHCFLHIVLDKDYGTDMFGGNIGRECRQMTRGNMFCILSSSFSSSFSSTSKQKNN